MLDRQTPLPKEYLYGAHRLITPEATFDRAWKFAPAMGITRVADVTGLDRIGIPVTMVTRPNGRSISVSQGKGMTLAAAQASGLMEAVEGYHAEHILQPLMQGSYQELAPHFRLANITRLALNKGAQVDESTPFYWIEGYDLSNDVMKWVPYEVVHTNYTRPSITGEGTFAMTSNGLASGNHVMEGTIHAINELVERDATTLWNFRSIEERIATQLDLSTITSAAAQHLLALLDRANMDVLVWDQPTDVGIPTFRCEIYEREQSAFQRRIPFVGYGTHLTRDIALTRAITEAAQSRLVYIAGVRDDLDFSLYNVPDMERHHSPSDPVRANLQGTLDYTTLDSYHHETLNEDLDYQLKALQAVGLDEVILVDLTKPEFNLSVVRVVIPGVEATMIHGDMYAVGERVRRIVEQQQ